MHKRFTNIRFLLSLPSSNVAIRVAPAFKYHLSTINTPLATSGFQLKGRTQVDGSIPSFLTLEEIAANKEVRQAQERGKFVVLFDSGIRTGSDVLKAIGMGVQGVLCTHLFLSKQFRALTYFLLFFRCVSSLDDLDVSSHFLVDVALSVTVCSRLKEIWARKMEAGLL